MSISTEITRLNGNLDSLSDAKTAIANAITTKGGTVASGDGFADFAEDIASIPSGGTDTRLMELAEGTLTSLVDNDITYLATDSLRSVPLTEISLPNLEAIGNQALYTQVSAPIKKIYFPKLVGGKNKKTQSGYNRNSSNYYFRDLRQLEYAILPAWTQPTGSNGTFGTDTSLKLTVYGDVHSDGIGGYTWEGCTSLKTIILKTTGAVTGITNTAIPSNCPIAAGTGYIYVPDSMKSAFQAATNWVAYASQIRGYSDAPAYNSQETYSVGDCVKANGRLYVWVRLTSGNSSPVSEKETMTDDWYCVENLTYGG